MKAFGKWVYAKESYPSHLVFIRVDDTYVTYNEDALETEGVLNTELTWFNPHVYSTSFNAIKLDFYLRLLIRAGKRVALYEKD